MLVKDRITVVETVAHQAVGGRPYGYQVAFDRLVETNEQPYERTGAKAVVGEEWVPLDCGWIESPGMIVLKNEEGRFTQTIPTSEEKDAAFTRVIEIGVESRGIVEAFAETPATETSRFKPLNISKIRIRCRHGEAHFTLIAFPG